MSSLSTGKKSLKGRVPAPSAASQCRVGVQHSVSSSRCELSPCARRTHTRTRIAKAVGVAHVSWFVHGRMCLGRVFFNKEAGKLAIRARAAAVLSTVANATEDARMIVPCWESYYFMHIFYCIHILQASSHTDGGHYRWRYRKQPHVMQSRCTPRLRCLWLAPRRAGHSTHNCLSIGASGSVQSAGGYIALGVQHGKTHLRLCGH